MEEDFSTPLQRRQTVRLASMQTTLIVHWHLIRKATAVTVLKAARNQLLVVMITQFFNSSTGFVLWLHLVLLVEL
jgi:hypothetical protein